MLTGETVVVAKRTETGRDEFNNPTFSDEETAVDNVLVAPGEAADVIESVRPEGVEVNYTLYFPKTFTGDLECEKVKVRGEWLDVIGHPDRYADEVCPTDWNMVVMAGAVHG